MGVNDGSLMLCPQKMPAFCMIKNWEVVQDGFYDTVENAVKQLPDQYKTVEA